MPTRLKVFAIAAVLAAGTSSAAMAQHACPAAGDMYFNGVCQPVYWKPVSGTVSGTANMLTPPAPPCVGARLSYGYCYPFAWSGRDRGRYPAWELE
jgi:hypothetical protein